MNYALFFLLLLSIDVFADPSSAILLRRKKVEQEYSTPSSDRYRVEPDSRDTETTKTKELPAFGFVDEPKPKKPPKLKKEPKTKTVIENTVPHEDYQHEEIFVENEHRSLSEDIQSLLLGGNFYEMIEYKSRLGENDIRKNQLEIAVSPGVMYNDSTSAFSFRKYTNFSPSVMAQADLWLTPFFGFHANFARSSNGNFKEISGSAVKYDHQFLSWGLEFRRFFSKSSLSPSLTFQIKMQEYQFLVASEATERVGFTSRGATLGIVAKIPKTPRYQSVYSLDWTPNINHREDETKLKLRSGTSASGTRIGLGIGGEFVFSRTSVLFWNVMQSYEKNSFKGSANTADPKTGKIPKNVNVDNSLLMFTFGYRWGN